MCSDMHVSTRNCPEPLKLPPNTKYKKNSITFLGHITLLSIVIKVMHTYLLYICTVGPQN